MLAYSYPQDCSFLVISQLIRIRHSTVDSFNRNITVKSYSLLLYGRYFIQSNHLFRILLSVGSIQSLQTRISNLIKKVSYFQLSPTKFENYSRIPENIMHLTGVKALQIQQSDVNVSINSQTGSNNCQLYCIDMDFIYQDRFLPRQGGRFHQMHISLQWKEPAMLGRCLTLNCNIFFRIGIVSVEMSFFCWSIK